MCAQFLELARDSRESFRQVSLASSPQQEGPDLLDSLIKQDRQERAVKLPITLPSLENLLKLLELQAASERLEARGRAITGGGGRAGEAWQHGREEQVMRHMASLHYSPAFPPLNLKLPPPSHPWPPIGWQPAGCCSPIGGGQQVTRSGQVHPTDALNISNLADVLAIS